MLIQCGFSEFKNNLKKILKAEKAVSIWVKIGNFKKKLSTETFY